MSFILFSFILFLLFENSALKHGVEQYELIEVKEAQFQEFKLQVITIFAAFLSNMCDEFCSNISPLSYAAFVYK